MKPTYVTIKNKYLEITFCNLGASIYRILFNGEDMLLTPKDKNDFEKGSVYQGKTIGRVCGRMVAKPFGAYNPQDNENGVSLHGGQDGLSTKVFNVNSGVNYVEFHYLSKDGEAGYPGNLILRVRYELIDNELTCSYHAIVDKPCLVALTNHAYFCLGEKSLENISLKMESDQYITTDERLLIQDLEKIKPEWNFKSNCSFQTTGDIDNFFLLNKKQIELSSRKYVLKIVSNFEGTQLFTDHWLDNIPMFSSDEKIHRGVAIEPQDNQLERKELLPNHVYERYIKYTFEKL